MWVSHGSYIYAEPKLREPSVVTSTTPVWINGVTSNIYFNSKSFMFTIYTLYKIPKNETVPLFLVLRIQRTKNTRPLVIQPKRVKFTNCSQFLTHIFLLRSSFLCYFLHIGIGQLDNDV